MRATFQALNRQLSQWLRAAAVKSARPRSGDGDRLTDWQLHVIALRLVVSEMDEELQGCPVNGAKHRRPW